MISDLPPSNVPSTSVFASGLPVAPPVPCDQPLDAATCRLLRMLSTRGAWLDVPADDGAEPATYRLVRKAGHARELRFGRDLVTAAMANGWLSASAGRLTLTPSGTRRLRAALAGGGDETAAAPSPRAKCGRSAAAEAAPLPARTGVRPPQAEMPGLDEAESPLGWLRRRKDRHGVALLTDEQFAAGERLRADVFFAGLSPTITASWSPTAGISAGSRASPGSSAQMLDAMVAARQRVQRAMLAVGPELSGILLDVCGFLKGLESVEAERGWPVRAGKVVLVLALSRLADHYGLTRKASIANRHAAPSADPQHGARIRHWGAAGYRPDLAAWDISQAEAGEVVSDDPDPGAEARGAAGKHPKARTTH